MAGTKSTDTYTFVNGSDANATTADEATAFKNSGTIVDANKVQFTANVNPSTITYRLITNLKHIALTGDASATTDYVPSMPQWMRSPLMKNEEDTYQYYAGATVSGTEYTVNNSTNTLRNLDIEDGKSVVYVRYDYDKSKQATTYNTSAPNATLEMTGKVPYRFAFNNYPAVKVKDNNTVEVRAADKLQLMHDVRSLWYFTGDDPYEFKISNYYDKSKYISVKDVAEGYGDGVRQPATMLADVDETYKFNTFMILKAPGENNSSPEKALTCYVSGSQRIFLIELSNNLQVYKHNKDYSECYKDGDKISAGNNAGQKYFRFVPAMAYHVITNSGQEAIVAASDSTGFETVTIPNAIHSPLLNKSDFRYYTRINTDDSGTMTVDPDSEIADNTSIYDHVAKGEGDIYIRYTYDRDSSPLQFLDGFDKTTKHGLDLSGNTWYSMATARNSNATALTSSNDEIINSYTRILRLVDNEDNVYYGNYINGKFEKDNYNNTYKTLSDKRLLWRPEGNDPYAIKIRNAYKGTDHYLSAKSSTSTANFTFTKDSDPEADISTFMYLNIHSSSDGSNYGATLIPTGRLSEYRTLDNWDSEKIQLYGGWGDNLINRLGSNGTNSNSTSASWLYFYKAPATRKYHYHAYNQTKGKWTWDAVLENDFLTPVVLDDQIARLYSKYETKSSSFSGENDKNVTGTNTFNTRAELEALNNAQFYSNEDMTERVFDTYSATYDVYPEIDEDDVYDIYFKYQPDPTATDIDGKTLTEITSTQAQIAADKAAFDADGKLKEDTKQANWWFMVLDTDEGISATGVGSERTFTGKQYFLRREDDGGVDWLDNAFALHKEQEDNYKNWTYSRLAETYREGDNDAFRERRPL